MCEELQFELIRSVKLPPSGGSKDLLYVRFCTDIPKEQRKKRRETEKILVRLGAVEKHLGKRIQIDMSP